MCYYFWGGGWGVGGGGSLSFFSFSYLFAAVVDLLLGLVPVQEFPRKHTRDGKFLPGGSQVSLREILF